MIAGQETFVFADDEYMITGSASGVNYGGANFTATVTDPLYYTKCSFFTISGTLTIEAEGESTIVIDYGEGECDNIATLTQDGVSTEITLGFNR